MSSIPRVELVQHNTAKYSELVAGIDPSLVDMPVFFEQDDGIPWISRFVDFVLDAIAGQVGFVKFQSAYSKRAVFPVSRRSPWA